MMGTPLPHQLHDSSSPGGEQFDALLSHVHQLPCRLVIEGEVATRNDLCVCVCVCVCEVNSKGDSVAIVKQTSG